MHTKHVIQRTQCGLIAISQGNVGPFELSYNPDDELFYVHPAGDWTTTLARFNRKANAVYWCKQKSKEVVA
jgi:hypothetical protein